MSVKMWSPRGNMDDKGTHIALLSGHTFIIPHDKEGVEVPARFRREAISRGCIPVGMVDDVDEGVVFDRQAVIREKIKIMLESDDTGAFTSDGKPVLDQLSKLCGFALARSEVNRVWEEMMKEEDGGDSEIISSIGADPTEAGKGKSKGKAKNDEGGEA